MDWVRARLGDHVDIQTGFPFKSSQYIDDIEGVRLLRGYNIMQGYLRWSDVKRWEVSEYTQYEKYALAIDDVVLAMDRPWIDAGLKYAWISEQDLPCLLVQRVARLRGTPTLLTSYIRYIVGSFEFASYLKNIVTGVTVPHISETQIRDFTFYLPPLETQRRIAAILSAYDDLIENNTRRISDLEAAAQALYHEWFVEFRFPGHESAEWVESELGVIPVGWEVLTVDEAMQILGGGTPSTKESDYWENGEINWYTPSDLTATASMYVFESFKKISPDGLKNSSAQLFPAYSVMMTSRATIGVTAINTTPATTNQGFITCIPNDRLSAFYIYFWLEQKLDEILSVASGATFKEITKGVFRKMFILIPEEGLHGQFVDLLTPLGQEIEILLEKNALLREARDNLLPRLISGELDVSEVEIELGELAL